jgi:TPR repeat protein
MKFSPLLAIVLAFSSGSFAGECKKAVEPLLNDGSLDCAATYFEICEAEADEGQPEALYYLSFFYFGLPGIEPDSKKGVEAVRTSAELGYGLAQYWMGWQHEVGTHLPQDSALAVSWYKRAAGSEEWLAYERLAKAYRNGELGLPVDEALAEQYDKD